MTRHVFFRIAVATVGFALAAVSTRAQGADSPPGALVESEDMGFLAVSARFEYGDRDVELSGGGRERFRDRTIYGALSLDLFPWLNLTAGAGQTAPRIWHRSGFEDGDLFWMGSACVTWWQFPVRSPPFLVSRIRLQSSIAYLGHEVDLSPGSIEWGETRGALTISAERLAEHWRRVPDPAPWSLVLYGGAVYSTLDGTLRDAPEAWSHGASSVDFEQSRDIGPVAGVVLLISQRLSSGFEARWLDGEGRLSVTADLALHF